MSNRGPIPQTKVVNSCLNGISKAAKLYNELSGGIPLTNAPEWMLQAEVARSLGNVCHYVTVETSVRWMLKDAEAETRGRLPRNSRGRIDVVVWSAADYPRYLVEVKKAWDSRSIQDDAKRLKAILKRGGSLHAGLMVVYSTAAKQETLVRRFNELADNSDSTLLDKSKPKLIDPDVDDSWLWAAAVYKA